MSSTLMMIFSLSVSGSILALILLAGKFFLKNRVSRTFSYYIWLLVLLRLVVPIATPVNVMSFLFGTEQPSVNSAAVQQTAVSAGTGTRQAGEREAAFSGTHAVSAGPKSDSGTVQTGEPTAAPSRVQTVSSEPQSGKSTGIQWGHIWNLIMNNLLWIWLAGSAVSLGWFTMAYAYFSRRIRRSCVTPHSDDLAAFERMCGKKRVRMACSSRVSTPMLIGVLRPVIVLPQLAYVQNGMDKELMNILRHELTHYRRKDVLYKWLAVMVTSLHWFNPLMLLIRGEIGRACELSCDEAVISGMSADEKHAYGNTLLALSASKKLPSAVLPTTLCEDKKALKERLISIMKYKKESTRAMALTLVLTFLLVGCAATLGAANSAGSGAAPEGTAASNVSSALMPGDAISISGENNAFSLYCLDFLDENSGWVIKDKYNAAYTETKSQLLRTQDGGAHWTAVGSDGFTLYKVKFVDTHEGWSISQVGNKGEWNSGSDDAKIQYTVMHTEDGGASWNVQWKGEQTSASYLSLWFQDASNGFALVGNTLLATQNGGGIWTPVSFGTDDFTPQSVSFTDRETGWVMGVNGKDDKIIVLHTKDGGKSWQRQFEKTDSDSAGSLGSIGIDFTDSHTGWFLTSDLSTWNGELYETADGGSSWQVINQIKCVRPTPTGIHFISNAVGWIPLDVGAGPIAGGLMATRDGGKSFQVVGADQNTDYSDAAQKITSARDVDFVSGQQGWAIGLNTNHGDHLLRTKDGGATWTQVYPALLPTQDISFVNDQTGFGIGSLSDFGALLGTSDGGKSWQVVKSLAQDYRPDKLSFLDARTGWMLASPGDTYQNAVLRTSDGGATWTEIGSLPEYMEIDYFRFFDTENGIAVGAGENKAFYRTSDGGKTWESAPRQIPAGGIDQFAFLSSTEGWEICNPGNYKTAYDISISRMTDGTTWQTPTEVFQGATSYAFTALSEQKAMMLVEEPPYGQDSRMKLLVTEDAGKTWEPHALPEGINGAAINMLQNQLPMQFTDDLHGWILSVYGLLATQDGGKTWVWE